MTKQLNQTNSIKIGAEKCQKVLSYYKLKDKLGPQDRWNGIPVEQYLTLSETTFKQVR